MCSAVFCFTLIDSSAKWLALVGFVPVQITFVRYLGHFVTSIIIFYPKEGNAVFRSRNLSVQIIRAVCLMVGTFFNFLALKYLPLNVTIAIFFASPLLVSLLSIPILGERVSIKQFAAILLGFVGVIIIIRPNQFGFQFEIGFSLIALFCASMYFVLTRMVVKTDSNSVSQLFSSGIPTILLFPFIFNAWVWPTNVFELLIMGVMGLSATLGHSFATVAHRFAKASSLAPVVYVQIIFMTIVSWLVFSHLPSVNTVLGTFIIIFSGIYLLRLETSKKNPLKS